MPTTPAQDEFLAITRKSQEAVIAAIKTWVETVKAATPRVSPLTDRLPKMPSFSLPLADRLPGREETVANAYRLAEQMLANQRKFAEDLLKLMTPLIPVNGESSPVSPASTSPAPASEPESPTPKSAPPKAAAKSTPARPAAKSTAARRAPKSAAARTTPASAAPKTVAAKTTPTSAAPKSTAAKSTPTRSAPKRSS
jgi:hypothetical protein